MWQTHILIMTRRTFYCTRQGLFQEYQELVPSTSPYKLPQEVQQVIKVAQPSAGADFLLTPQLMLKAFTIDVDSEEESLIVEAGWTLFPVVHPDDRALMSSNDLTICYLLITMPVPPQESAEIGHEWEKSHFNDSAVTFTVINQDCLGQADTDVGEAPIIGFDLSITSNIVKALSWSAHLQDKHGVVVFRHISGDNVPNTSTSAISIQSYIEADKFQQPTDNPPSQAAQYQYLRHLDEDPLSSHWNRLHPSHQPDDASSSDIDYRRYEPYLPSRHTKAQGTPKKKAKQANDINQSVPNVPSDGVYVLTAIDFQHCNHERSDVPLDPVTLWEKYNPWIDTTVRVSIPEENSKSDYKGPHFHIGEDVIKYLCRIPHDLRYLGKAGTEHSFYPLYLAGYGGMSNTMQLSITSLLTVSPAR
jgi:hypothetical protein